MYSYGTFFSPTDRYNIQGADEHTLLTLTQKLNYPYEDILRAVQEVGPEPEEVEEYIRDRYNRC